MELFWFLLAAFSIWLYEPLAHRLPQFYLASRFDKRMPLMPAFVIPYLALYPYLVLGFALLYTTPFASGFYAAISVAALAAALFWYVFPTGVHRPRRMHPGALTSLLRFVYGHDGEANAFPSAHVFLSFLISLYLALAFPAISWLWWTVGFFIALSTIAIKQHNILDIIGGLVWALGALAVVQFLLPLI